MKKFVAGLIIGVGIASSFNVSAAVDSIIGKQVEGTALVKLNGADIGKESIIVNGSSYAPVRAVGEALGLDVDFQNNEVVMTNKSVKVADEVKERNQKISQLRKENQVITQKIAELRQITLPYDVFVNGKVKEKDDLYFQTENERNQLIQQREVNENQIEELRKLNEQELSKP